jgi:hypothetical protein
MSIFRTNHNVAYTQALRPWRHCKIPGQARDDISKVGMTQNGGDDFRGGGDDVLEGGDDRGWRG